MGHRGWLAPLFFSLLALVPDFAFCAGARLLVRAKGSGRPVARVEIKAGSERFYTDKAGKATFPLQEGLVRIELFKSGFENLVIPIEEVGTEESVIFLLPAKPDDNEIIVVGKSKDETSRKTISITEAKQVAPGGDPAQVAKLLPGVQASSFGDPRLIVRGSGPEDSIYYFDQIQVPFIFHSIGNISITPDTILDQVTFLNGGFGAQYSNATGGVLKLVSKTTIPEHSMTELRTNVPLYWSIYHERPLDEDSFVNASFRRSLIQYILPTVLKTLDAGDELTVTPYFGDAHAQYFHRTSDGFYRLQFFNSQDGIRAVFPFDQADNEDGHANVNFVQAFNNLSFAVKKNISGSMTVMTTPNVLTSSNETDFLGNRLNVYSRAFALPVEFTQQRESKERNFFGMEYIYYWYSVDLFLPQFVRDDPFYDFEEAPKIESQTKGYGYGFSPWFSSEQKFGDLTLIPGINLLHWSAIKKTAIDPRLQARYPWNAQTLKLAFGQYSKAPEFDQSDVDFGNPDLGFSRSIHSVLGMETEWDERWTTDFQLFHKKFFDLVRSDSQTRFNNDGTGESYGFEVFVRRNLTALLFGWMSYTWSQNLERASAAANRVRSTYDQTHVLTFAGDYKLSATWSTGGRFQYTTGNTYTPIREVVYNSNLDKYQPRSTQEDRNTGRLPASSRLSLFASKDFLFDTWTMKLRFGIEEAILGKDARNLSHNYDYSKEEFVSGPPVIPYIELRAVL